MTPKQIKNVAGSVRQRLMNLARKRNEDFGLTLVKYGLERLLYRISQSQHKHLFILKGALLFELWTEQRYRPTRDADFLAEGDNSPQRFAAIFKDICLQKVVDDGLAFDPDSVKAELIKEDADYEGVRVTFEAYLENARIPIQIDIGFGDVVTPSAAMADYPTLLDFPAPRLRTYSRETSIAEKFETMITLGIANSRMKDFHDIRTLAQDFEFDGRVLASAIKATFERRKTPLPSGTPLVFTPEFYQDKSKQTQWASFSRRLPQHLGTQSLEQTVRDIEAFLASVIESIRSGREFKSQWSPGGPWKGYK